MIGRAPFGPAELSADLAAPSGELAGLVRLGRELDAFALAATAEVASDFASRVMAVLAVEPAPQPVAAVGRALAGGRPLAVLSALRDAWRVALGGGRPTFVRAQALALVLLALLTFGAVGSFAGAAALGTLERQEAPAPLVPITAPPKVATPAPTPTATVEPTETVEPSETIEPSESPSSTPTLDPTPSETPDRSARPTPEPSETPEASETAKPSDDGDGHGGGETPEPTHRSRSGG